ncbi:hypothetical protein TNCV_1347601 [Trichonephila clavipes]|nr:hypothetical protein TNCV_1347601 [Trichonephila clavipes]
MQPRSIGRGSNALPLEWCESQGMRVQGQVDHGSELREYRRHRRKVNESELVKEPHLKVTYVEGGEDATMTNYSDLYRHRLAHEKFKINHNHLII